MTKTQENITYKRVKRLALSQLVTTQKKHRLGTVSKKNTGGLKLVLWYQPHPYIWCWSRQIDVWFAWKIPDLSMYHIKKQDSNVLYIAFISLENRKICTHEAYVFFHFVFSIKIKAIFNKILWIFSIYHKYFIEVAMVIADLAALPFTCLLPRCYLWLFCVLMYLLCKQ